MTIQESKTFRGVAQSRLKELHMGEGRAIGPGFLNTGCIVLGNHTNLTC